MFISTEFWPNSAFQTPYLAMPLTDDLSSRERVYKCLVPDSESLTLASTSAPGPGLNV